MLIKELQELLTTFIFRHPHNTDGDYTLINPYQPVFLWMNVVIFTQNYIVDNDNIVT